MTVGARGDTAAALRVLTHYGGSPPADPCRSPPPLSWRTWRNQRRRRASPCSRPPAAIGIPFALPGCPPGPLWATFLPPRLSLRLAPATSSRCIYHIIPTPPYTLFFLTHVTPLSRISLLIHVGVRVGVRVGV